jgi:hypothetical protein
MVGSLLALLECFGVYLAWIFEIEIKLRPLVYLHRLMSATETYKARYWCKPPNRTTTLTTTYRWTRNTRDVYTYRYRDSRSQELVKQNG